MSDGAEIFARLGRKIKIFNTLYLIEKLDILKGVIDKNGDFSYMDGDVKKTLPVYSDVKFLLSNNEYCFCDEYRINEVMTEYPKLNTIALMKKKVKKLTDDSCYMVSYNPELKIASGTLIDNDTFERILDINAAIEEIDANSIYNDGKGYTTASGEYFVTTIAAMKYIADLVKDGEYEKLADTIMTIYIDYIANLAVQEVINDEVKAGKKNIIINNETGKSVDEDKEEIEKDNSKTYDQLIEELKSLIGMEKVKEEVEDLSRNLLFNERIENEKLDIIPEKQNLNMVFLGNPGTGKTTIALILSEILNKLGYANGKFKKITAQDLIGSFVGETENKTAKLLNEMRGGVIFIDEAYALTTGVAELGDSFGLQALNVLIEEMGRNDTIFIFAGYHKEMEKLITSNSGFKSRIQGGYFNFRDYTLDELMEMFINRVNKAKYILGEGVLDEVRKIISEEMKQQDFGNGRFVDHLYGQIRKKHASNTVFSKNLDDLKTITLDDLNKLDREILSYQKILTNKIGF